MNNCDFRLTWCCFVPAKHYTSSFISSLVDCAFLTGGGQVKCRPKPRRMFQWVNMEWRRSITNTNLTILAFVCGDRCHHDLDFICNAFGCFHRWFPSSHSRTIWPHLRLQFKFLNFFILFTQPHYKLKLYSVKLVNTRSHRFSWFQSCLITHYFFCW